MKKKVLLRVLLTVFAISAITTSCSDRDENLKNGNNSKSILPDGRVLQMEQVYIVEYLDKGDTIPFDYNIIDSVLAPYSLYDDSYKGDDVVNRYYYDDKYQSSYHRLTQTDAGSEYFTSIGTGDDNDEVSPENLEKWTIKNESNKTYELMLGSGTYYYQDVVFEECITITSDKHSAPFYFNYSKFELSDKFKGYKTHTVFLKKTYSGNEFLQPYMYLQIVTDKSGNAFYDEGYIYIDVIFTIDLETLYPTGNVLRIKFKILE